MYSSSVVEILIASPGDVTDARDAIQDEISEWNIANSRRRGVSAVAVRWETHAVPEMGAHPQRILNRQIVERCDLVVAVFRGRLGTPTPDGPSGTAEEIEQFIQSGRPVALYKLARVPGGDDDADQIQRLDTFIQSLRDRGLISEVTDVQNLRREFRRHLGALLADIEPQQRLPPVTLNDFEIGLLEVLGQQGRTLVDELADMLDVGSERLRFHFQRMEVAGLVDQLNNAVSGDSFVLTQGGRAELYARGLLR